MHARNASLRRQLLIWLLIPSLVLWLLGAAVTYYIAISFSNVAYDRNLLDSTRALAQQVRAVGTDVVVDLPSVAQQILETDQYDQVYYQVKGPNGEFVAGNAGIPPPPADDEPLSRPRLHDAVFHNQALRVASLYVPITGAQAAQTVLVQVGETTKKRRALAHEILAEVVLPQLLLIALAAVAVWFGVGQGLSPLQRLQVAIRDRSHRDLRPLSEQDAPEEVRPLIHAINDLLVRLGQALSVQQRFVADAAHQLRTPLAGLKTQTELALRETDAASARHALRQLHASADRLTRLVNQLLSLARTEPGTQSTPALPPVDLNALVRRIASEWVPEALKKNSDLGFEGAARPVIVSGDHLLLQELVINLLDNAIRYSPPGSRITARVGLTDDPLLVIEDNGPGIPAEERERVFQRFYRVLGVDGEGSGLGLAIVQEIAQAHGATVTVNEAEQGQGTRVEVAFPPVQTAIARAANFP